MLTAFQMRLSPLESLVALDGLTLFGVFFLAEPLSQHD